MPDTDTATAAVETAGTAISFELPNLPGTHTFDCATIPGEARLDLLKGAVRSYIANRVNAAYQRHVKLIAPFTAYEEASKADPLQTAVPKPEGDKPALDLAATLTGAIEALTKGEIRQKGKSGATKERARKDPLVAAVTKTVIGQIYDARKAENSKYTYPMAAKEVGTDGVAYLRTQIETKVAAGADRAALEKFLEERYMKPARALLGLSEMSKAGKELPSIL